MIELVLFDDSVIGLLLACSVACRRGVKEGRAEGEREGRAGGGRVLCLGAACRSLALLLACGALPVRGGGGGRHEVSGYTAIYALFFLLGAKSACPDML